jgi:LytS/YehU family sensor histidine kinase
VPAFILQPLVENSIKHAVARTEGQVKVRISAHKRSDRLELSVENSDPGTGPADKSDGFGIGLENVSMRLAAVYGGRASLTVKLTPGNQWVNLLSIPWMEHLTDDARTDR